MNFLASPSELSTIRPGHGSLKVELVSGQSSVTSTSASSPLKLLVPRPRGPSVWAYLSSFGGGLVAGDETNLNISLGTGTRCFISTQASTKVYRNPYSLPCSHQLKATLDADSFLVLAPDPIQSFAGSSYTQRQEFHMQSGSNLVLVDWFCSGRAARGERWNFTKYESRNDILVDGERLVVDSLRLDSEQGSLAGLHRMGRFNCFALIVIVGRSFAETATRLLNEIAALPVTRRAPLLVSASPIRDGALLRLAGEQVEDVSREIQQRLGFVKELLHEDPWARKW